MPLYTLYFSFANVFEMYIMDSDKVFLLDRAFYIQHYGFKIRPHCDNTAVHSFSLPSSTVSHACDMIISPFLLQTDE